MNRREQLITIAAEECAEVAQRLSKVNRFGWGQRQTPQHPTNVDRVMAEFYDLVAVLEMAGFPIREELANHVYANDLIDRKKEKVEAHLVESAALGTLEP